jgi:hypothetical protein
MRKSNFIQKIVDNPLIQILLKASLMVSWCYQGCSELDKLFRLYDTLLDLNNNNLSEYFQSRTLVYYMTLRDKFIDYFSYRQIKKTLHFRSIINIIQVFSCVEYHSLQITIGRLNYPYIYIL